MHGTVINNLCETSFKSNVQLLQQQNYQSWNRIAQQPPNYQQQQIDQDKAEIPEKWKTLLWQKFASIAENLKDTTVTDHLFWVGVLVRRNTKQQINSGPE